MVLPHGAVLQLGDGERYVYDGPEVGKLPSSAPTRDLPVHSLQFASLYSPGSEIHGFGRKDVNSTVIRVQRISDKRPFVAKIISGSHISMAHTEIQVFKELGRHPSIVQFIEAFYDPRSRIHRKPSHHAWTTNI